MIPVIQKQLDAGHNVILGGSGKSGELLKKRFNNLLYLEVPSYSIKYPSKALWLPLIVFLQLPFFFLSIIREHFYLRQIVKKHRIHTVISDNRYGLFSFATKNIIITHQLSPVFSSYLKIARYPVYLLIRILLSRFDECWIPDFAGSENLTGRLSHQYPLPRKTSFIGPLSRFSLKNKTVECIVSYDLVIILSGQQPELGNFTREVLRQVSGINVKTLIISGLQKDIFFASNTITVRDHLEDPEFQSVLMNAGMIICRAGYSSIMDLVTLNKTAILIPTPGQPEQEYLAVWLKERGCFRFISQKELDIKKIAGDYLMVKMSNITVNPSRKPE